MTIELIVPAAAGCGSDRRARLVAKYLSKHLAEPVQVVNRTGTAAGYEAIASAPPDGSVIGLITGEIGMLHWQEGATRLAPAAYTPLALPYAEATALVVAARSPFTSIRTFIEELRGRRLRGSGGPAFGLCRLALAGLMDLLRIEASRLEWTETVSGRRGLENVLAGRADVASMTMTGARDALSSGEARALIAMDDERHARFAHVPTVTEALGVRWQVAHWRGLVAPRGLPPTIAGRYIAALRAVANDRAFASEAADNAFTVRWRFDGEFARYLEEDDRQLGHVIRLLDKGKACVH